MKKIIWIVSALMLLMVVGFAGYSLFYIDSKSLAFKNAIEDAFNATDEKFVKVSEVTDFDWDLVCFFPPNFWYLEEDIEQYWGVEFEVVGHHIPNLSWPTYLGGYLFIKDNQVTEKRIFNTLGYRFFNNKFSSVYKGFSIREKYYYFLTEHSFKNDGCISKENAALKAEYSTRWNEGKIMFTNIVKEN